MTFKVKFFLRTKRRNIFTAIFMRKTKGEELYDLENLADNWEGYN